MAGMQIAIKRPLRRLCQLQNTRKIVMHSSVAPIALVGAIKPIAWAVQVNPAILLFAKSFPLWNFSPRGNSRKNQGFSPTRNVRFSLYNPLRHRRLRAIRLRLLRCWVKAEEKQLSGSGTLEI